jgi:hypothetical protein
MINNNNNDTGTLVDSQESIDTLEDSSTSENKGMLEQ